MSQYSILHDINNQPISATNPLPITGSFGFSGGITITSSINANIVGSTITQSVTVTNPITQLTASISNFPATQTVSVSNPITVGNFPATQTVSVSNPITVGNFPTSQTVSVSNPVSSVSVGNFPTTQSVERIGYATTALSSVTASVAATDLLASNGNRVKFMLSHTGSATAFVALGATATTSSFTVYMNSGDYFEQENFQGRVSIIFSANSASTSVYATSITK